MRRSLRHSPLFLAVGLAAVGCGGPPDLHALAASAQSWAATASFTTDRLARGAITRPFAVVALDRASTELQQLASSAPQVRDTNATMAREHATLTMQLAAARRVVTALDSAAARDDRARLSSLQRQLDSSTSALASVSNATESR